MVARTNGVLTMTKHQKFPLLKQATQWAVALGLSLAAPILVAQPSSQASAEESAEQARGKVLDQTQSTEKRVMDLLDAAEAHIKQYGVTAVNDFNRDPRFADKELYMFSLSRTGYLLSSGGWSASLVGENVQNLTDEEEQPFFQKMLEQAKNSDEGSVEYIWFNPMDGQFEPKITHFRVIDNVLIAAGYFSQYSTEQQAKELLDVAVSEYFKSPEQALRKFRNRQSGFRNPDQYVFVLSKTDRTIVWTPSAQELIDTSVDQVEDIFGKVFLGKMIDSASPNLIQQMDYWWFSPITKQVELRRAFYQQVGDSVVAVGTFVLPVD